MRIKIVLEKQYASDSNARGKARNAQAQLTALMRGELSYISEVSGIRGSRIRNLLLWMKLVTTWTAKGN